MFVGMNPTLVLLLILRTLVTALSTSDYCRFEEEVKEEFRSLECSALDLDACATKARQIAQGHLSGSWGAIIIANKSLILDEKIDYYVHSVTPHPSHCRLLVNDSVVLELFRTGYRKTDTNNQIKWIWSGAMSAQSGSACPHSALRELIAGYSLAPATQHEPANKASHSRARHGIKSRIYAAAKTFAHAFHAETGHKWNVFITRDQDESANKIGLSLPHYVFDARPGVCIGRTLDGYNVNAAIIGFSDEFEEATSSG